MKSCAPNAVVRLPSDELRVQLMVQVAKLYYELEKTQSEIAAKVGLTRWQVSQLMREARELGLRPEQLRDKERAVAVSAGRAKHRMVLTCLRAGYINVLVTDEATARYCLERRNER